MRLFLFAFLTAAVFSSSFARDYIDRDELELIQKHLMIAADLEIESIEDFKDCINDINPITDIVSVELNYCLKNHKPFLEMFFERVLEDESPSPWDNSKFIKLEK